MTNKTSSHDVNKNDQHLISAMNQALDKSLDDIDDVTLQRLKNSRIKVLKNPSAFSRKWVQLSVAVSVAALLLIPFVMHQQTVNSSLDSELEIVSQDMPVSAEEMDDIDMLMALEDTDA